jgi:tetratricopeptide (TPR) repeat protein
VIDDCTREVEQYQRRLFPTLAAGTLGLALTPHGQGPLMAALGLNPGRSHDSIRARVLRAEAYEQVNRLDKALADLDLALGFNASDLHTRNQRGNLLARRRQWVRARADFAFAVAQGGYRAEWWANLALTQLELKDLAGYRQTCAGLVQKINRSETLETANLKAWACVLRSDAVRDWEPVVHLAGLRLKDTADPNYLNTLGAALYRAGRYKEAIARLEKARAASADKGGSVWDALFLALAHRKMEAGSEAARSWRQRAEEKLKERPEQPWSWQERVALDVLARELAEGKP